MAKGKSTLERLRERRVATERASDQSTARKPITQAMTPAMKRVDRKNRMGERLSSAEKKTLERLYRLTKTRQDERKAGRGYGKPARKK
jgi:hypothetical protein